MCVRKKKEAKIERRVNSVFNQHLKTTWANETVFAFICGVFEVHSINHIFSE